jgi:hypothetical protein
MAYVIAVIKDDPTKIEFDLYGDDDGGYFLSIEDAREAANDHFGLDVTWSILPVNRLGTISGSG